MSFTEALNAPIQQLTNASNLLSKVNFPPESLLLAGLLTVSINSLARLTLVIPVFLFSGVGPSWSLLLFPAGLAGLLLLGFTVGLLLAPIGALYRDVGQTLTIATSFLFLVTPVAYTNSGRGKSRISAAINPIGPMLVTARDWLTGGPARPSGAWFAILALELVFLAVGWILFRLAVPHLVDRISI
jgi:lipopolysaccharide transport system permease protein